jgi:hypothetical protein
VGSYGEVFWGLFTTFLAFMLGLVWDRAVRILVNARARRFWRPLIAGRMSVVLGRFRGLPGFEASGIVGAGDNLALRDLCDHFLRIGFKRFTVFYNDQFDGPQPKTESPLRENLVLLGGPDANSVTREVLSRLRLGIEFLEVPRPALESLLSRPQATDLRSGRGRYRSRWWHARREREWRVPVFRDRQGDAIHGPVLVGDSIRTDCGVVIRCPNPFNPARTVVILCGSYGYGTWGAVRLIQSAEFLGALPRPETSLECLLKVEVTHDMPQGLHVEFVRPVEPSSVIESVQVPRIVE